MIKFLFWNIHKKDLRPAVLNLARTHHVDVIMLAECQILPTDLLMALNEGYTFKFHYSSPIGCERIEVYSLFPSEYISPMYETDRYTIRHLKLPGSMDILLAIVHLPSKMYLDEVSQTLECVKLSESIKRMEHQIGHSRTVLVGDLNLNPFEDGVVSASGLHGVMTRQIAKKGARTVQSSVYPFFYNPMWNMLGDMKTETPGTIYYVAPGHKAFFWNLFDQVLIRPDLLDVFDFNDLKIITSDGVESFLSRSGIPDDSIGSDHLPLVFSLGL